jgi:hypothetical protein
MLTINYNNTDYSLPLEEFDLPSQAITLLAGQYIYIGYYKPINNFYVAMTDVIPSTSKLILEYETASGFVAASSMVDKTYGLANSGKVSFTTDSTLQISSLRFTQTLYWVRLSVDVSLAQRTLLGINVLFSDDKDLEEVYPGIMDNLPTGKTSFINFHVSAKKEIVQVLRRKYAPMNKMLTEYDLLNVEEVHEASKYLTLANVFEWLSDSPADKWEQKAKAMLIKANNILDNVTLTIDQNDDGVIQDVEKTSINFTRVVRV